MPNRVNLEEFYAELQKIAMARIGMEPNAHVAYRLLERLGVSSTKLPDAERSIMKIFRDVGGEASLGQGEFYLPVKGGHFVFSPRGPEHVATTWLEPGMIPKGKHLNQSMLSKVDVKDMKKRVNRALKAALAPPPKQRRDIGRTIYR